jgi:hypothetical protein
MSATRSVRLRSSDDRRPTVMRDLFFGPVLVAIVFVAVVMAIILCFCIVLGSYAHLR